MINSAEQEIKKIKSKGITGQNRDVTPSLEACKIALCANDEDYGFRLKLDWKKK